MSSPELADDEVSRLLEAIFLRYGYDFRGYAREAVSRRLSLAQHKVGASSLGDLQRRILADEALFPRVLEQLSVRVSDVFRDPEFFLALRQQVVPTLRTYPILKIWLAGCAGGEEVYSLAILLHEEGLAERSILYATDMSVEALNEAKDGIYAGSRLSEFARNYRLAGGKHEFEDYCSFAYGRLAMDASLRRQVVFFEHNLISDYSPGQMNMVLCRNVLIYFDLVTRRNTLRMFQGCLSPSGYLGLGSSEVLPLESRADFTVVSQDQRIYRARAA